MPPDTPNPFVVAFNRNRDFYQVPLALAEDGLLETLVTDFYSTPGNRRFFPSLAHRSAEGISPSRVQTSLTATILQAFGPRLGLKGDDIFWHVDRILGRKAASAARRSSADLLIYSLYAFEAFTDPRLRERRKILYLFHPHWKLIYDVLARDNQLYPQFQWTIREDVKPLRNEQREDEEVRRADFILCASTFTQRSLVHIGVPARNIGVVPYGIDVSKPGKTVARTSAECHFLFVGQGLQRKGLHHLLLAWEKLALPNATLTLVCSRMDGAITPLIRPGIRFLSKLSSADLQSEFERAHVFIMPSLVEGFGLVYLEALNAGCFIIGTANTGLPDLHPPAHVATVVAAGSEDDLVEAIDSAFRQHQSGGLLHQEIIRFSETQPWSVFRARIREQVSDFRQRSPATPVTARP